MIRKILRRIFPVFYIGIIVFLIPQFDSAFTTTLSYLRVEIGKLALTAGLTSEGTGMLLGIYKPEVPYSFYRLDSLERSLDKKFDILSFYLTWGERDEDTFPFDIMKEIDRHGSLAMITWEPWLTEFEKNKKEGIASTKTDLGAIARGEYDNYIREWARESVVFGKPFFLRFAHEMNNPQYPWSDAAGNQPKDFIDAWQHVHKIFRDEGAKNVIFVWSPKGTMPDEFYPGGEYVDWIGTGVFNYGSYAEGVWHSFEFIYEPIYRSALRYDKPIMIAELGCSPFGGSQVQWYSDAFKMISRTYRETKAIVLFNNPADQTLAGSVIDWSIDNNSEILKLLREQIQYGTFNSKNKDIE
jgi:beta-mannanase